MELQLQHLCRQYGAKYAVDNINVNIVDQENFLMKQRYPQSGGIIDCLDRSLSPGVHWTQLSRGDINLPDGLVYGSLVALSNTLRLFVTYQSKNIFVNDYVNSKWQGWKTYGSLSAEMFSTNGVDLNDYIYGGGLFCLVISCRSRSKLSAKFSGMVRSYRFQGGVWNGFLPSKVLCMGQHKNVYSKP